MIREKFDLTDKCGFITGASRGLGAGMAAGLAEMGADIVLAARDERALSSIAESISGYGGRIMCRGTDVSDDASASGLVDFTLDRFDRIDFVFLNAGIVRRGESHLHALDDFDEVYRVNVRSVFLLAKLAAAAMIDRGGGGSIVITDSVVSRHGSLSVPGYTASKGAVNAMIRTLANDWGKYGIRVNGVGPGFCDTDMTAGVREKPERYEYLSGRMALGRWGKPEDFAGIAAFLASDASSYITGTTIYVDGGFLGM